MALALPRGIASDCVNAALVFYAYTSGFLKNPLSLEYQIFDIATPAKQTTPVQVFPGGGREAVDLTDCATGGDRLGTGRFVAQFTPSLTGTIGTHIIRWFITREAGGTEETFEQEFLVLSENEAVANAYATVADMRAEGVTDMLADDRRVLMALRQSKRFIERITRRFFEPRFLEIKVDGKAGAKIQIDMPIIALEQISIDDFPLDPVDSLLSEESIRVYNRHIEQGLEHPDDRNNPKIEALAYFHSGSAHSDGFNGFSHASHRTFIFPRGQQNITLRGVFGYTEPDGSSAGSTPFEIKHVSKLLAIRELPAMLDFEQRAEFQDRFKVTKEKTKQQQIEYIDRPTGRGQSVFFGYFTGDPIIDNILSAYVSPPTLGAT